MPGTYDIDFEMTATVEGLTLHAIVAYAGSGLPATSGQVKFYVCRVGSEVASSSACATGRGRWNQLRPTQSIIPQGSLVGHARYGFGLCDPGTVVGFRFYYDGPSGGIADGWSAAEDFTF